MVGKEPENLFPPKESIDNSLKLPIQVGISPENIFPVRLNVVKLVNLQIHVCKLHQKNNCLLIQIVLKNQKTMVKIDLMLKERSHEIDYY